MATDFDPDQIARHEFGHSLRGYDPREVRAFLEGVASRLAAFERETAELRQQIGAMDDGELESHIDQTATEIANVLHTARVAAQSLQDRAKDEAETFRLSAKERTTSQLRSAEQDAYQLRKAAWETSTKMLDDVGREAASLKKQADKDTLAIIGEAERNAHRKVSEAKREAESRSRASRLEAEKLLVEARARRDEMLDEAERATDAAQERVRALERRRDELMRELESIRAETLAASKVESVTREEFGSTTVKLVPSESATSQPPADFESEDVRVIPATGARWADGSDTVRLIPAGDPAGSSTRAEPVLDHESLVDELIDDTAERDVVDFESAAQPASSDDPAVTDTEPGETDGSEESGVPAAAADEAADDGTAEDADATPEDDGAEDASPDPAASEADAPPAPTAQPTPEPVPAPDIPTPSAGTGDELGTLFDLLRDPDVPADPSPGGAEGVAVSEDTAVEDLVTPPLPDPVELRDRALLPVMNRALRAVKRALSEVQNGEMERLKDDLDGFTSEPAPLAAMVDPELLILVREAHVAGVDAAAVLTRRDDFDRSGIERPAELATTFAADANEAVVEAVQGERDAGAGVREASAAVSKVYRVWRSDEAERRVRELAHEYYQQGLQAGLARIDTSALTVDLTALGL